MLSGSSQPIGKVDKKANNFSGVTYMAIVRQMPKDMEVAQRKDSSAGTGGHRS